MHLDVLYGVSVITNAPKGPKTITLGACIDKNTLNLNFVIVRDDETMFTNVCAEKYIDMRTIDSKEKATKHFAKLLNNACKPLNKPSREKRPEPVLKEDLM